MRIGTLGETRGTMTNPPLGNLVGLDLKEVASSEKVYDSTLTINGREFKVDLEPTVKFMKPIEELSDLDIDRAFDDLTAYRYTILTCMVEVESQIQVLENDLEDLLNRELYDVRATIINKAGLSTTKKNPTDKEVNQLFFNKLDRPGFILYTSKRDNLIKAKKYLKFLIGLDKIITQRGDYLKVMATRRRYIKGGKGYESGI